jgi:hypothetical protein
MQNIADFLKTKGIMTKSGLPLHKDQIKKMLTNPFYYGHFRYGGEVHEGKHKGIISKQLFDKAQAIIARRCHPQKSATAPQAFCGLLTCGACNMAITAEKKIKHQKNGNIHEYVYYRCTRKSKTMKCTEPAITEPKLAAQLSDILQGYALPKSWAATLETMLAEDEKKANEASGAFISQAQAKLANLQSKLQRLLDSYLDQDIQQSVYREKQAELMSEKKSLEEQIGKLTLAGNAWIEPMRQWIKMAVSLCETATNGSLVAKKEALLQIDGLNLFLKTKKAQPTAAQTVSPPKNIWFALRATKEKTALSRRNFPKSSFLVEFYSYARTYFSTKC